MTDNGKLCSANKLYGAVRELRAQLAEKDKEIERLKEMYTELRRAWDEGDDEAQNQVAVILQCEEALEASVGSVYCGCCDCDANSGKTHEDDCLLDKALSAINNLDKGE